MKGGRSKPCEAGPYREHGEVEKEGLQRIRNLPKKIEGGRDT